MMTSPELALSSFTEETISGRLLPIHPSWQQKKRTQRGLDVLEYVPEELDETEDVWRDSRHIDLPRN